jgi:hypothetical protein
LKLADESFEEKSEKNKRYMLTIFWFSVSMNEDYCDNCGYGAYTYFITVKLSGLCVCFQTEILFKNKRTYAEIQFVFKTTYIH